MTSKADREAARARDADAELDAWWAVYDAMRLRPEIQAAIERRMARQSQADADCRAAAERFEARVAVLGRERDEVQARIDALEAERTELEGAALTEIAP